VGSEMCIRDSVENPELFRASRHSSVMLRFMFLLNKQKMEQQAIQASMIYLC